MAPKHLAVGFGTADITPAMGIQLAGDIGRHRPTEEIRMPLSARALIVEDGDKTICIIQADVIGMAGHIAHELAVTVANRLGTAPEAVMLHTPQSHSSPAVGHYWTINESAHIPADCPWLRGGDDRYIEPFKAGVLAAVNAAMKSRVPATLHLGRTTDGRAAFNRRFAMRGGAAGMQPEKMFLETFPGLSSGARASRCIRPLAAGTSCTVRA